MVYRGISRTGILSLLSCYDIILYVIQVPILVRKIVLREAVQSKQNVMEKNNGFGPYLFGIHMFVTDRIRSVGEGYVFTGICLFTRGGAWSRGV